MDKRNYVEIEHIEELLPLLFEGALLRHYAFQNIDFTSVPQAEQCSYTDCIFLDCKITTPMRERIDANCYLFPSLYKPYNMFKAELYSAEELYQGYDVAQEDSLMWCYDSRVYAHYIAQGKQASDIGETLARSLHDHSISDALHDLLDEYDPKHIVAIMGGHALSRCDEGYEKVVRISKSLTERGYLMVSGGGPGAMEATHLGAWLAGRNDEEVAECIAMLCVAPTFQDDGWMRTAFDVMRRYPRSAKYRSVGIPTWFYGHEPATPFASHIAKYFDNSIREDGLLAIAKGGVIYTPGSAGTMQEVFQDAAQNHYNTFGFASPMVFLGVEHWTKVMPVYPMFEELQSEGRYKNLLLTLTDSVDVAVETIENFK